MKSLVWFLFTLALGLVHVVSLPILRFGWVQRKPSLPRLPPMIVATIEGQTTIRIRQWHYAQSVYQLMSFEDVTFLGDLFYNEEEFGIAPTPEQATRARELINTTVAAWLGTEMGRAWRLDNRR